MKKSLARLLFLALSLAPLHADDTKPARKTPAEKRADAFVKANAGKKVKLAVSSVGEIGSVRSDAPYGVIPVTTAGSGKTPDIELFALVPPTQIEDFIKTASPQKAGNASSFGAVQKPGSLEGVLLVVGGETCVAVGAVKPDSSKEKPSALYEAQLAAEEKPAEPAETPADKTDKKKSDKKSSGKTPGRSK